ncbi:MAG TPA: hypothetical protein VHM00_13510 [Caldimonas sp.]|jgi:hypothetical protein|nr:hypothetical protein [Caldimonas sp.]HEX2542088.1 hypothetical protein [Caldimonas sp.]
MSPPDPFRSTPGQDDPPSSPWWGTLAVALVLTIAAAGAGLLAGSIA